MYVCEGYLPKNVIKCMNKKGWKGIKSPQTDSVPSVDRAIPCFNKHIFTQEQVKSCG